LNILWSSLTAD